jgi:hypothetical protein
LKKTKQNLLDTHPNLLVNSGVEARGTIASSLAESVGEAVVLVPELRSDSAIPSIVESVSQRSAVDNGPVVPANKVSNKPLTSEVLDAIIGLVGHAPAVSTAGVLVVDNLGALAIEARLIGSVIVVAVARGSNSLDVLALNEDDDVLPVMGVAIARTDADRAPATRVIRKC